MNGAVSKTVVGGFVYRGFESLPLRFSQRDSALKAAFPQSRLIPRQRLSARSSRLESRLSWALSVARLSRTGAPRIGPPSEQSSEGASACDLAVPDNGAQRRSPGDTCRCGAVSVNRSRVTADVPEFSRAPDKGARMLLSFGVLGEIEAKSAWPARPTRLREEIAPTRAERSLRNTSAARQLPFLAASASAVETSTSASASASSTASRNSRDGCSPRRPRSATHRRCLATPRPLARPPRQRHHHAGPPLSAPDARVSLAGTCHRLGLSDVADTPRDCAFRLRSPLGSRHGTS